MGLKKCPRCELNYIREDESLCNVCRRSMKGEPELEELAAVCSECGENPAIEGSELCAICLREVRRQENLEKLADELNSKDHTGMDDMDDIEGLEVPMEDDDIPKLELEEIDKELGGQDLDRDDEDEPEEEL